MSEKRYTAKEVKNLKAILEADDHLVGTERAAELLKVNQRRVLVYINDERLKADRIGARTWAISIHSVAKLALTDRPNGQKGSKAKAEYLDVPHMRAGNVVGQKSGETDEKLVSG